MKNLQKIKHSELINDLMQAIKFLQEDLDNASTSLDSIQERIRQLNILLANVSDYED